MNRRSFALHALHSAAGMAAAPLIFAEKPRVIRLPARQARAVAIGKDGLIAVAADRRILFLNAAGVLARELETERPARALCHDGAGRLWLTLGDDVAWVNDEGAVVKFAAGPGRESALTGIAVADDGRIFVADSALGVVWRLDAHGAVLGRIKPGEKGFAVSRAFFPIAWQGGHLLVAEPGRHRIHRYSAQGERLASWGQRARDEAGFAGCCNPAGIATLADGSVLTVERGQGRVRRFDASGKMLAELAGPAALGVADDSEDEGALFGCESALLDVAAASDGRVVVLDRASAELRVLS